MAGGDGDIFVGTGAIPPAVGKYGLTDVVGKGGGGCGWGPGCPTKHDVICDSQRPPIVGGASGGGK